MGQFWMKITPESGSILDGHQQGGKIEFGSADGAWHRKMKHAGVSERVEERPWQLAGRVNFVGARANQRRELPGDF